MEKLNELPKAFYGVIQDGHVVMLPADDGQWLNKTSVAEAFRELEQRAEENQEVIEEYNAAMCESNKAGYAGVTAAQTIRHLMERAEAAEAKLTGLANKKPDIMVSVEGAEAIRAIMNREMSAAGRYVTLKRPSGIGEEGMMGIYIRPAPAADLTELVPDEFPAIRLQKAKLWIDCVMMDKPGMKEAQTISAILRNIEEAK